MQYSKLFGKTIKESPADASTISHKLLHQAGYIRESTAGRYFFLPLGQSVQLKIIKIIKEEMDRAQAQEMLSPVLHPLSLWKETNRDKETGFELMTIKDHQKAQFALGGTAEEMFVDVVRKFQISYKDLPFNVYQFSTKFRDELRARGGLLRLKEFIMKDSYSFHADEDDFKREYDKMKTVYQKIFDRCGLKTIIVESDNGYIGGDYCHEFVVESEVGESHFLYNPNASLAVHKDIIGRKKLSKKEISEMGEKRGIEVGNIFQLGYHYSKKMANALFTDVDGKKRPFYMGCYGIGIGRTMAAIVEIHHDEKGIIWPKNVAPYQVHFVGLDLKDSEVNKIAYAVYDRLTKKNVEILFDDRIDISAGEKFADADLIGIPVRLIVSKRTGSKIEYKERNTDKSELLTLDEILNKL